MELQCAHCQRVIEFSREAPKFCSYCGEALSDTGSGAAADETHTFHERQPAELDDVPERVGGYRLARRLGRGGMGVVYEAEQEETGRRVAIKLLPPSVRRTDDTVRRFLQEGELAASLSHPRSTFVYAAGEEQGQFYIVMELMAGGTLKDLVDREGKLPVERAVDYTLDVIDGLEAAHDVGVIHRDLKPSNCFLDHQGRAKVGDYGLSKSLVSDAALTRTGAFMGTPQFAAPEQVKGGKIDQRTDIYAVGATLFCLITGRPPFSGDAARVIAGIASDRAPRVRSLVPEVPRQLDRVISQTLEKDPERRPAHLALLRTSLLPFSTRGSSIADLGRRMAAYFLDLVVLGFLAFLLNLVVVAGGLVASLPASQQPFYASQQFQWTVSLTTSVLWIGYFAVAEGWLGCGFGKWLTGLRVVGPGGEPAGVPAALVRALLVPGLMLLADRLLPIVVAAPETRDWSQLAGEQWIETVLAQMTYPLIGWSLTLLCLVTMRRHNGYRGLHELASGTRVVRRHTLTTLDRLRSLPITLPARVEPQSVASFRILGRLSPDGEEAVYLARDASLGRPVWVLDRPARAATVSAQRMAVARPTRPFWLAGGESGGRRWDAFEAVHGSPLAEQFGRGSRLRWHDLRGVLADLAGELTASLDDGTLPSRLTLEQIWVDRSGLIKLLDFPLHPGDGAPQRDGESREERAVWLLQGLLDLYARNHLLPGHVLDFAEQLTQRPPRRETLDWAHQQLQGMADRPSTWAWDDRLGVLAVSFCTETTVYSSLVFTLVMLLSLPLGEPRVWVIGVAAAVSLAVPMLLGFLLRGGPVFRLTGIQVRRPHGRLASGLRCACRALVAWLPLVVAQASLAAMLATFVLIQGDGADEAMDPAQAMQVAVLSLVWTAGSFLHGLGGLCAVISPRRGIQDWLAGTQLLPK